MTAEPTASSTASGAGSAPAGRRRAGVSRRAAMGPALAEPEHWQWQLLPSGREKVPQWSRPSSSRIEPEHPDKSVHGCRRLVAAIEPALVQPEHPPSDLGADSPGPAVMEPALVEPEHASGDWDRLHRPIRRNGAGSCRAGAHRNGHRDHGGGEAAMEPALVEPEHESLYNRAAGLTLDAAMEPALVEPEHPVGHRPVQPRRRAAMEPALVEPEHRRPSFSHGYRLDAAMEPALVEPEHSH